MKKRNEIEFVDKRGNVYFLKFSYFEEDTGMNVLDDNWVVLNENETVVPKNSLSKGVLQEMEDEIQKFIDNVAYVGIGDSEIVSRDEDDEYIRELVGRHWRPS